MGNLNKTIKDSLMPFVGGIDNYFKDSIWDAPDMQEKYRGYTILLNKSYKLVRINFLGKMVGEIKIEDNDKWLFKAKIWLDDEYPSSF